MADKDYKTTIVINADAANAVSALGHVSQSLSGVGRAVGAVMRTLSRLNWAIMAVQTIVSWVQQLREWSNRAATAARELAERLRDESIATAAAHTSEAYKKLNKELAEANRLEKERNQILDRRKSAQRDIEDANLEFSKASEIVALDPSQEGYADAKAAIERKYERQAAETRFSREQEDATQESRRLYAEAARKEREANAMQKVADRQWKVAERRQDVSREADFAANRSGSAEDREKAEKSHKAWEAAYDAAKATQDAVDALRRDAASLRLQGGEIIGSPGARARRDAALARADIAERDAAVAADARWREKEAAQQRDQSDLDQRLERRRSEEAWKREFKEAGQPAQPQAPEKPEERQLQMLQEREDQARTEMGELRKRYDAEMNKDVQSRDEQLLDELKTGILDAQDRMFDARSQREDLTDKLVQDAQNQLDQYADRFAGAYAPGGNRLTAMGLGAGSGVDRVQEQMASSLRELVRLGQEQIAEIKVGNIRAADNVAVYGD